MTGTPEARLPGVQDRDEDVRIPERGKRDEDGDPSKRSESGRAPVVLDKDCFMYVPLPSHLTHYLVAV